MVRVRPGAPAPSLESPPSTGDAHRDPARTSAPAQPPAPTTTAADRARVGGPPPAGNASHVRRTLDPALFAAFPPPLRKAMQALTLGGASAALEAALTDLAQHPQAAQIAVAALTGAPSGKVKARAVERFTTATAPREVAVTALLAWHRGEQVAEALAGHHGVLADLLRPALLAEPDAARLRRALATVARFAEDGAGSYRLAGLLTGAGCLAAGQDWRTQALVDGADVIGTLAGREVGDPLAYDDPARAAAAEAMLGARGLFASPKWAETHELSNHRGHVGEALRMATVEAGLAPGERAVQGVLVVESPPELWALTRARDASAWAEAHGLRGNQLKRYVDEEGRPRWGHTLTEIDVAVFRALPDGRLQPVRLENVKAGVGSAATARQQNTLARDVWARPEVHLLFPRDDGQHGVTEPAVDRSEAAQAGIALVTAGPSDDPRYDAPLGLSSNDITALCLRRA